MKDIDIFLKVKNHLLVQMKESTREDAPSWGCFYRGDDGLKCAIGCLIDDDNYTDFLEGKQPNQPIVRIVVHRSNPDWDWDWESSDSHQIDMLSRLQMIHDNYPVDRWQELLEYTERTSFSTDGVFYTSQEKEVSK